MKQIILDTTKTPKEIVDSQCYRRTNDPCSDSCPFFDHMPATPSGDIISLTCNNGYQLLVQVTGYVT